jgi:hypothetical protein
MIELYQYRWDLNWSVVSTEIQPPSHTIVVRSFNNQRAPPMPVCEIVSKEEMDGLLPDARHVGVFA